MDDNHNAQGWGRCIASLAVFAAMSAFAAADRYASPHGEIVKLWPDGKMPVVCTNQTYAPFMEFFVPEKVTTDAFLIVAPGG